MATVNATLTTKSTSLTSRTPIAAGQSSQPNTTEVSSKTMLTTKPHSFSTQATNMKTGQSKVQVKLNCCVLINDLSIQFQQSCLVKGKIYILFSIQKDC